MSHGQPVTFCTVMVPFFRMDTPPLAMACLQAHIAERGFRLRHLDLRHSLFNFSSCASLGYRHHFAGEIPDLPLILTLARNHLARRPLLEGFDQALRDFVRERPLGFFQLRAEVEDLRSLVERSVPRLRGAHVVGFTTYTSNFLGVVLFSLALREMDPTVRIVLGGPQVSQSRASGLLALELGIADDIVVGEGEEELLAILEEERDRRATRSPTEVAAGSGLRVPHGEPLDLTTLRCPDFSFLEAGRPSRHAALPVYGSRGCPFACEFCSEAQMHGRFRQVPVEQVVSWMERLNRDYATSRFHFADSLLNVSLEWLERLAQAILTRSLRVEWWGYFRAQMTTQLAATLKKAGLARAFVGAESFSESLLESMRKKRTPLQNENAIEAFCSAGVPLEISSVVGFPGETTQDADQTLAFFAALEGRYPSSFVVNVEPFQFVPASPAYSRAAAFGIEVEYWDQETAQIVPAAAETVSRVPKAIRFAPGLVEVELRTRRLQNATLRDIYSDAGFVLRVGQRALREDIDTAGVDDAVQFDARGLQVGKTSGDSGLFPLFQRSRLKLPVSDRERHAFQALRTGVQLGMIAQEDSKRTGCEEQESLAFLRGFLRDLLGAGIPFRFV